MRRPFVFFLISASALSFLATYLYLPALPEISTSFHASNTYAQLSLTLYLLGTAIPPLIIGPYSDKIGRKPVLIAGLLFGLLGSLMCYFSMSIEALIVARFVQGLGLGAMNVTARSIAPDLFKGKELAALLTTMATLIPLFLSVAPVLGGIISDTIGWRHIFSIFSLYLAIHLYYFYFYYENSNSPNQSQTIAKTFYVYKALVANRAFMSFGLYPCVSFTAVSVFLTISPFLFQSKLGLSATQFGALSLLNGVTVIIAAIINKQLLRYINPKYLIGISVGSFWLGGLTLLILTACAVTNVVVLFIPCSIVFLGIPFGYANTVACAFKHINAHNGAATALILSCQLLTGSLASGLFSLLPNQTFYPLAMLLIFCGMLSTILYKTALNQDKSRLATSTLLKV